VYRHEVVGYGRSWNAIEAKESAASNLLAQINDIRGHAPVPCMKCARYQRYMFREAGEKRYGRLRLNGLPLSTLGCLIFVISMVFYLKVDKGRAVCAAIAIVSFILALVGVGMAVISRQLIQAYNPNEQEPEQARAKLARDLTMSPAAFDVQQTDYAQRLYAEYCRDAKANGHWPAKKSEQLAIVWWVAPTIYTAGGTFSFRLTDQLQITVDVPQGYQSGDLLAPRRAGPQPGPVWILLRLIRVHPSDAWKG
jgi:hypothetical protein